MQRLDENVKEILEQALMYADMGWKLHPCKPSDKRPLLKAWHEKATNDPKQVRKWWEEEFLGAAIGCKTGPDSGFWVLDADLPEGPKELEKLDLPRSMKQQTGSGGIQIFFAWNGKNIRNGSRNIGPGLDVRGNGGYIILPPSLHPSGNRYKWLDTSQISPAPDWLAEKAANKERRPTPSGPNPGSNSTYGLRALQKEISKLMVAMPGIRNETLNECAWNLGQLVAGQELDEEHVVRMLYSTARVTGLSENEIAKTIGSGLEKGKQHPRKGSFSKHYDDIDDNEDRKGKRCQVMPDEDTCGHNDDKMMTFKYYYDDTLEGKNEGFEGNLASEIKQFIQEIQAPITNQELDREFGLTTRQQKKYRSVVMTRLEKNKIIRKDKRNPCKWCKVNIDIDFIDLHSTNPDPFTINLPLSLKEVVRLPKKCIIVLAGTSNAGKTALAIEFIKQNLNQKYPILYLMSEMGSSEYKQRVLNACSNSGPSLKEWNAKVKAASISFNFSQTIEQHNPNGFTVIDYLEEVDGEYYKITSHIRDIYDALDEGIALVCLQKHSKSAVGRGGEGTSEKARLYMTLDKLAEADESTISALKIYKAKDYVGRNPNGKEIHIAFVNKGSEIQALFDDWQYCSEKQRQKWIDHYESKIIRGENIVVAIEPDIYFTSKTGKKLRIKAEQVRQWQDKFKHIDVEAELIKISQDSKHKDFLTDRKYFFQLAANLNKKNRAAMNFF